MNCDSSNKFQSLLQQVSTAYLASFKNSRKNKVSILLMLFLKEKQLKEIINSFHLTRSFAK